MDSITNSTRFKLRGAPSGSTLAGLEDLHNCFSTKRNNCTDKCGKMSHFRSDIATPQQTSYLIYRKILMCMDQRQDTRASMATVTTTIAPPAAGQPFSLKLRHHDASYLPVSRFNTIDGLLKSHGAEPEQTPLICYPKEGTADFELHTGQDLDRFTDSAVQFYLANGLQSAVSCLRTDCFIALTNIFRTQQQRRLRW